MVSTFVLSSRRAGVDIAAPDLVIPTWAAIFTTGILIGLAGAWQSVRGFKKRTTTVLIAMISLGLARVPHLGGKG